MLVNRRTWVVKRGCMQKAVALAVAAWEQFDQPHVRRFYVPDIAPFDTLVLEIEFEDLEDYQKFWAEWAARPETAEAQGKFDDVTETGGSNEIWTLVE